MNLLDLFSHESITVILYSVLIVCAVILLLTLGFKAGYSLGHHAGFKLGVSRGMRFREMKLMESAHDNIHRN